MDVLFEILWVLLWMFLGSVTLIILIAPGLQKWKTEAESSNKMVSTLSLTVKLMDKVSQSLLENNEVAKRAIEAVYKSEDGWILMEDALPPFDAIVILKIKLPTGYAPNMGFREKYNDGTRWRWIVFRQPLIGEIESWRGFYFSDFNVLGIVQPEESVNDD